VSDAALRRAYRTLARRHHPDLDGGDKRRFQLVREAYGLLAKGTLGRHPLLADNAGEIVFDRLLVDALPAGRVTVALRGLPVLNDATLDDACVASLDQVATVIENGSDAPGTVLSETSPAFQRIFQEADLILSKGQGNFETLSDTSANVYFLLTVKCSAIGEEIGAPVGTLVVTPVHTLNRGATR
jgi:uncharacterized protein with ATP-grasp and redox domains